MDVLLDWTFNVASCVFVPLDLCTADLLNRFFEVYVAIFQRSEPPFDFSSRVVPCFLSKAVSEL